MGAGSMRSMRRLSFSLLILASAAAAHAAQRGGSIGGPPAVYVTDDRIDRVERWLVAVDTHVPGRRDEAVTEILDWPNAYLGGLWAGRRSVVVQLAAESAAQRVHRSGSSSMPGPGPTQDLHTPAPQLHAGSACSRAPPAACCERQTRRSPLPSRSRRSRSASDAAPIEWASTRRRPDGEGDLQLRAAPRRAAARRRRHADARSAGGAGFAPHRATVPPPPPAGPSAASACTPLDGQLARRTTGRCPVHWEIARMLVDGIVPAGADKPAPGRDEMAREWYVATAAWMQEQEDHDSVHLDRARAIFPKDPDVLFLSGCEHATYASSTIQNAMREANLPPRVRPFVDTDGVELRRAETFFRAALAVRPDFGEARIRLGRVLALLPAGTRTRPVELRTAVAPLPTTSELASLPRAVPRRAKKRRSANTDAAREAYDRAAVLIERRWPSRRGWGSASWRGGEAIASAALRALSSTSSSCRPAIAGTTSDPLWAYPTSMQARDADRTSLLGDAAGAVSRGRSLDERAARRGGRRVDDGLRPRRSEAVGRAAGCRAGTFSSKVEAVRVDVLVTDGGRVDSPASTAEDFQDRSTTACRSRSISSASIRFRST